MTEEPGTAVWGPKESVTAYQLNNSNTVKYNIDYHLQEERNYQVLNRNTIEGL